MSERRLFLGGAAAGLLLAVGMVALISLGTVSPYSTAGMAAATTTTTTAVRGSATTMTTTTTSTPVQEQGTPSNLSSSPSAAFSGNRTTTNTAKSQSSSGATQGPPSQMDNTSTTGSSTSNPSFSIPSLIQALPAIAIAMVLSIAVYQFSVRRVDRTDAAANPLT